MQPVPWPRPHGDRHAGIRKHPTRHWGALLPRAHTAARSTRATAHCRFLVPGSQIDIPHRRTAVDTADTAPLP